MKIAFYPGSFDSFHYGHLAIVKKASEIFDKVIIGIGINKSKKRRFDRNEMKKAIEKVMEIEKITNVEVIVYEGLTFKVAQNLGVFKFVRGVRDVTDYLKEEENAMRNEEVSEIDTIFIRAGEYKVISSTFVNALLENSEDVSKYVPKPVLDIICKK